MFMYLSLREVVQLSFPTNLLSASQKGDGINIEPAVSPEDYLLIFKDPQLKNWSSYFCVSDASPLVDGKLLGPRNST